jgi:hypothetical protein
VGDSAAPRKAAAWLDLLGQFCPQEFNEPAIGLFDRLPHTSKFRLGRGTPFLAVVGCRALLMDWCRRL